MVMDGSSREEERGAHLGDSEDRKQNSDLASIKNISEVLL